MAIVRTSQALPGGGTVTLPPRPVRKRFKFQNQGANPMTVTYGSGFAFKNITQWWSLNEPWGEGIQGAIVITGTAGDTFDAEEEIA